MSSRVQPSIKFRCFPPGVMSCPDDLELLLSTKTGTSHPLKFQHKLCSGRLNRTRSVNYMFALHYSKVKFGTIDSIKILSYRTNITIQLYVLLVVGSLDQIHKGMVWVVLLAFLLFKQRDRTRSSCWREEDTQISLIKILINIFY